MNVQLYVYDLSKGLARQMSRQFLGVQIDAVYHTSIVLDGVETFFGSGVQTSIPGSTHHGQPIEIISLGQTHLPRNVIAEYLESLKKVYTMESYDLFLHNCNNFSNDFATFLVGKGIPEHITSLPQTVLNTPFGQMMKPQLDQALRGVTQAPVPSSIAQPSIGHNGSQQKAKVTSTGVVHQPRQLAELDALLDKAKQSCGIIFFTSATCPPCRLVYPAYDELAAEAGDKAVFIKVDVSDAHEISSRYQIRATPTFYSYLFGEKENEWVGANESQLRGNVALLLQMAHPPHPHSQYRLSTLIRSPATFVTYAKIPPLDKLMAKLGDPLASNPHILAMKSFISHRQEAGAKEASLPSLHAITEILSQALNDLSEDRLFALIDLLRLMLVDLRVSGYFAADQDHTIAKILAEVTKPHVAAPYKILLTTVQMSCNMFTSPLCGKIFLAHPENNANFLQLISIALLEETHPQVRVCAASLAHNIALANHNARVKEDKGDLLSVSSQVELMACLLEAVDREQGSVETIRGLVTAVGLLRYHSAQDGELRDLAQAMEARAMIKRLALKHTDLQGLVSEVEQVLD